VTNTLQTWASRAVAQRFADIAFGLTPDPRLKGGAALAKFRQLGFGDEDFEDVLDAIRANVDRAPGGGSTLHALNLDRWDNATREKFLGALFRWTRQVIQENDPGNLARWMTHPGALFLFQFRSFVFGAWTKSTLYNLHHFSPDIFATVMLEFLAGAAGYSFITHVRSLGAADRAKYLEDRHGIDDLMLSGISRATFSSVAPMLIDSVAMFAREPIFDYRSSGTTTGMIFGNPGVDLANGVQEFTRGLVASTAEGRQMSQRELQAGIRALPFGNWLPFATLLAALTNDRPYRAPRPD